MTKLTEKQKVHRIYNLIGERGLYVNSGLDVFQTKPEEVGTTHGYKLPLIKPGTHAYSSPLLFAALTSLMNHGTMLVTGAPGIGKTTGAELAGHFFTNTSLDDILAAEILGNPQLKTEDTIASLDTIAMVHDGKKIVLPTKFLQSPVKIWDEVNRTPADLVSSAMRLVDVGTAIYQGVVLKSPPGVLFATANYADEGTFQLTPPFLDRFDVAVMVTSPPQWDLRRIRERGDEKLNGNLDELLKLPEELKLDHEKIRNEIKSLGEETEYDVSVVSTFADFVYSSLRFSDIASDSLVRATKGNAWAVNQGKSSGGHFTNSPFTYTTNDASIRTVKAMMRYARAYAWINGGKTVGLADLKSVLPYLLWHKLEPTEAATRTNPKFANDRISFVGDLVSKIETDFTEMLGSDAWKQYGAALIAISDGKARDRDLSDEEIRNIARNAIAQVGRVDKPWALTLAAHISSVYNTKYNAK
jgi:MoxR-like ATPase